MLRRVVHDRSIEPSSGEHTRPMTLNVDPLAVPRPPEPPAGGGLRERLRAAGLHLLVCLAVVGLVSALVFGAWYPSPMPQLLGVGAIIWIVVGVDVVVGPLFTLIVYDRRKPRLKWDLATIFALQLAALAYGVHTLHAGRPAFVVMVKDRFEVISPAELRKADLEAARDNPHARFDPIRPRWIAARPPTDPKAQLAIAFEALTHGRDVQHHPDLYVDYASEAASALERALPISRLRALNPTQHARIDALVARSGLPEASLRYLPLRGPAGDGTVLIDATDARVVGVALLVPW
ncbi:MAG: hypothetical protein NTW15_02955 [Burkholderiales bacterium]|nr:hypothetical protein [Burkholderiales bacterium]